MNFEDMDDFSEVNTDNKYDIKHDITEFIIFVCAGAFIMWLIW